jgi:hypothetical protein
LTIHHDEITASGLASFTPEMAVKQSSPTRGAGLNVKVSGGSGVGGVVNGFPLGISGNGEVSRQDLKSCGHKGDPKIPTGIQISLVDRVHANIFIAVASRLPVSRALVPSGSIR